MNGRNFSSALLLCVVGVVGPVDGLTCTAFPPGECQHDLTCDFGCDEHKRRLIKSIESGELTCQDHDAKYATAVASRTPSCNDDVVAGLAQGGLNCLQNDTPRISTCNYKRWFTPRQSLVTSIATCYVVVLNLIAFVIVKL